MYFLKQVQPPPPAAQSNKNLDKCSHLRRVLVDARYRYNKGANNSMEKPECPIICT